MAYSGLKLRTEYAKIVRVGRSEVNMVLNVPETTRLIRDGRKGGMEVGDEGDYIPIATLSPPE